MESSGRDTPKRWKLWVPPESRDLMKLCLRAHETSDIEDSIFKANIASGHIDVGMKDMPEVNIQELKLAMPDRYLFVQGSDKDLIKMQKILQDTKPMIEYGIQLGNCHPQERLVPKMLKKD